METIWKQHKQLLPLICSTLGLESRSSSVEEVVEAADSEFGACDFQYFAGLLLRVGHFLQLRTSPHLSFLTDQLTFTPQLTVPFICYLAFPTPSKYSQISTT